MTVFYARHERYQLSIVQKLRVFRNGKPKNNRLCRLGGERLGRPFCFVAERVAANAAKDPEIGGRQRLF
jgi:hypothetical protein